MKKVLGMKRAFLLWAMAMLAGGFIFLSPAMAQADAAATVQPSETITPNDQNYRRNFAYQTYYDDYLALKRGKPVDLIFIGDSITEQWRWGAGRAVWKAHFEDRALDFGLGGDTTQQALWRLLNIDLSGWSPKVAIILIGTNNRHDEPGAIAAGVSAVIAATQKRFPGIKVVLVSILPNARAKETMEKANELLRPLADGKSVVYLDLAAQFTPVADSWKGLQRDKLHLTEEGYQMWAAELEPLLAGLLK
jgi:lysophospholipase L1-like esterase